MTTIVYRDGILAADRIETIGDTRLPSRAQKIRRLSDGRLYAWCGESAVGEQIYRYLDSGQGAPPDTAGRGCAVIVDRRGRVSVYEGQAILPERGPYIARGSGMCYALGALAMGASARQAVAVAARFDTHTGGGIQTSTIQPRSRSRR